jgi:hypothetical protein
MRRIVFDVATSLEHYDDRHIDERSIRRTVDAGTGATYAW